MILHYLGLDHIGHVEGPFSPLIKTKLFEMDEIIAVIQKQILAWVKISICSKSTLYQILDIVTH